MRPKRGRAGGCGIGHEGKQRVQPLFFPNAKDRISASNKGIIKQENSKQDSAKKTNIGEPPEGAAGARALGGGRIGESSEPKSPTPCDRSEGGRGDAVLGMRENSECNRCFSRMRKTAYRQAIRVISSKQRASKVAPKRVISGSPRGADGSKVAWGMGAHGERSEPKSDRPPSHRAGGRGQHGAGMRFLRWRRSESAPRYMLNGKR